MRCSRRRLSSARLADIVFRAFEARAARRRRAMRRMSMRPDMRRGPGRLADLLGAGAAARSPQHRNPGGDEFARLGLGGGVAQGGEAELDELVVPGGDAKISVLGLGAVAGQVERRELEARALAGVVDGEV